MYTYQRIIQKAIDQAFGIATGHNERKAKPMTVSELIDHLKTFDQNLLVCYKCCSDNVLLEKEQLIVVKLCKPRPDGWIENARPDKESFEYLMFPGN